MLEKLLSETRPIRLVLLSGEQVTPNADAVALFSHMVPLASVHVACTSSETRSLAPARRVKKLIKSPAFEAAFPKTCGMRVWLSEPGLPTLPQAVREWFVAERSKFPGSLWVLNLTGGLKSMNYGLLDEVGLPDVLAVYRELGSGWFTLTRGADGVLAEALDEVTPHAGLIDRVPVLALAAAQYGSAGERDAIVNLSEKALPPLPDIVAITQELCANGFQWKAAWQTLGLNAESLGNGPCFELYVCALLREAGIENLAWSVTSANVAGIASMEVDVAFHHRGALWTVDCKLPDAQEEPAFEQIRVAIDAAERLGGRGARAILMRPSWEPDEARSSLAKRSGAVVFDRARCARLLEELASTLSLSMLSEDLRQVSNLLSAYRDHHGEVLVRRDARVNLLPKASTKKLPDLLSGIRSMTELGQGNTLIFLMGGEHWLAILKPPDEVPAVVPRFIIDDPKSAKRAWFEVLRERNDLLILKACPGNDVPNAKTLFEAFLAGCERQYLDLVAVRRWLKNPSVQTKARSGR